MIRLWNKETAIFSSQAKCMPVNGWIMVLFYSGWLLLNVWMTSRWFNEKKKKIKIEVCRHLSKVFQVLKQRDARYRPHGPRNRIYLLDRKSSVCFYLFIFLSWMDIFCVIKNLFQWYQDWLKDFPSSQPNKRNIQCGSSNCDSCHLHEFHRPGRDVFICQ